MQVSTIGVDLAKNVFQVHGVDNAGKVVISRQLRRKQVIDFFSKIAPCLVGMEACGTAHHWAREVSKLGHTVHLIKERLGGISKQGDRYLRRLLVVGATAVVRHARQHPQKHPWVMKLLGKKPAKLVAVAVANKIAHVASAIMTKGGHYRAPALAAAAGRGLAMECEATAE
jgi:transposase